MNRGDYSRISHKPFKHYTGVLEQQGRVDLDADSNEADSIAAHLRQTQTRDVIGPCGFPKTGDGFNIVGGFFVDGELFSNLNNATGDRIDTDLRISPGRGYVDGILCELEATPVLISEFVSDNRVKVPTLRVDGREFQVGQWIEFLGFQEGSQLPEVISRPVRIIDVPAERTLAFREDISQLTREITPSGLRRVPTYTTQPDYPDPPELELGLNEFPDVDPGGDFRFEQNRIDLVYLDVWERHITSIEDPDILEVALNGPDTTTRVKTEWQVKVLKGVTVDDCEDEIEGWPPSPSGGRLSTEVITAPAAEDPCLIGPDGGYRGLENRLYRVEIHQGASPGAATFKWSRDNGSVVFPVEEFGPEPDKVKVKRLGRDQVLRLRSGDWVEVLDDHTEYRQDHTEDGGITGTMARIDDIDEEDRILTLDRSIPADTYNVARHPRIRRWDQTQNVDDDGLIVTAADPIPLEDGIQVRFSGDNFKVGDYWVFAARTATGDVERLTDAPSHGIKHHYCRLALIDWEIAISQAGPEVDVEINAEAESTDCRLAFPPLTEVSQQPQQPPEVSWPTIQEISWANDLPLSLGRFNEQGLLVAFSEPIHQATVSLDTFIVTLELPERDPVTNFPGHRLFIVPGRVEQQDESMWRFRPEEPNIIDQDTLQRWLSTEVELFRSEPPTLRCRVVLKGNFILDTRTGERPLDGDVFGRLRDDEDPVTGLQTMDLIFPSGDGNKGGDFESWFYLSREE